MGLGKILGSISPAFGMASGKGLFGQLPLNAMGQSGFGGILGMLLSHGSHGSDAPAPAAAEPSADLSPLYGDMNPAFTQGGIPGAGPQPSGLNKVGMALHDASGGDPGLNLGQPPQGLPQHNSGLLQSVMADQGGGMGGGGGWHDILMRLGVLR